MTKKPKMQASKELWTLVHTDKESFSGGLDDWYESFIEFLRKAY